MSSSSMTNSLLLITTLGSSIIGGGLGAGVSGLFGETYARSNADSKLRISLVRRARLKSKIYLLSQEILQKIPL